MGAFADQALQASYDYIVIGAGAAGAVIASRLSEDPSVSICLLESGPSDWNPYIHVPVGFVKTIFNPKLAWQFASEPNALTNGRAIPLPQGRVLGGSTSINGLVYNRGLASDYDGWAALGNPGWSYAEVLPYFKRTERMLGRSPSTYHGRAGEIAVSDLGWIHPVCEAFMEGAQERGLPRNPDYNGASQAGVGYFQRFIDKGRRVSTSTALLRPARVCSNLHVLTHAHASEILFSANKAVAVGYRRGGTGPEQVIGARREIIVSAGAINTPKLLQLSGIGNGAHLQGLGIPVQQHLAGVGENLRDHYSIRIVAKARNVQTLNELSKGLPLAHQIVQWLRGKPSMMAVSPSLVHIFWKTLAGLSEPDVQGVFSPASYKAGYVGVLDDYPGMTCGFWAHRPESTGHVRIQSREAMAAPVVQPNYLQTEGDRAILIRSVKLARQLFASSALSRFYDAETLPGSQVQGDDELLDFIRRYGVSSYHLNGTARMGPSGETSAVVDAQLRVHGLQGLRVADSSVMPMIPSANICAASIMIGERAADLVRGKPALAAAAV